MSNLFGKSTHWMRVSILIILISFVLKGESLKDDDNRTKKEIKHIITSDEKQGILSGFSKINNTLNKLSNTFANDPPEKCTLSFEKLLQLKDDIDDAMTKDDLADGINCDVDVNNPSGSCNELVKMIQCGVTQLSDALSDATDNAQKLAQLQIQYEELQEQYQKFIDDNENYISQGAQKQIDDLKTQLQEQQELINKLLTKLLAEIMENIAFKLKENKVSEAVDDFVDALNYQLDRVLLTEGIVEKSYELDCVDNIVYFLKDLPIDAHSNVGYDKLIDLMGANDQLNNPIIARYYTISTTDGNHNERIQNFKNKLSDEYFKQIKTVGDGIRNGDYDDFNKILKFIPVYKYFAEDFVLEAYTEAKDFSNVFDCYFKMFSEPGACIGITTLFDLMRKGNLLQQYPSIFTLASFYKNNLHNEEYDPFCNKRLNDMKDNMPKIVRDIIWGGGRCNIRDANNHLIYSNAGSFYFDVVLDDSNIIDSHDDKALWKFTSIDTSDGVNIGQTHFEITSVINYHALGIDCQKCYRDAYDKVVVGSYDPYTEDIRKTEWILSASDETFLRIENVLYHDVLITNSDGVLAISNPSTNDNNKFKIVCN